jgi:diaminopimelate decarboxylase
VHIGSQITDIEPFSDTMERVADLLDELRDDGHEINFVDAGGGLGIAYDPSGKGPGVADRGNGRDISRAERSQPPSTELFFEYVSRYAESLLKPLRGMNVHLLLEPGRSIVGPAGALITAVLYRKTNHSKKFLITDAGMNDLLRPSLYNAFHEIIVVELQDKNITHEVVDIVGPVCETGDFFARDRVLPRVEEGDWLAILDTGAYGLALASHYNTRPHPAEVLVDGKSAKVIRRRETAKDLMRGE